LKLIGEDILKDIEPGLIQAVKRWEWESESLFQFHMALEVAPEFKAASSDPRINEAFIYVIGYETEDDFIKHWDAIREGEIVEGGFNASFPSVLDPMRAPKGYHVGLISELAPYDLKDGGSDRWYNREFREGHAKMLLDILRRYAPNITDDHILMTYICTPKDIENKFLDMKKGGIKQGAYTSLQMGFNRPNEYCSNHRTPVKKLYVCGASTYSGGTVIWGPGYLCANRIAEDLGIDKWWKEVTIDEKELHF